MKTLKQNEFDYRSLRGATEVALRIKLLGDRFKHLPAPPEATVAEIGLVSGDLTKMLATYFDQLVCIDMESQHIDDVSEMLRYDGLENVDFVLAKAEEVAFEDRAFDH